MAKVLVIAEAGVNHNGSVQTAKEMIDVAVECGADIIKFQTAQAQALVSGRAAMADYQKKNTGSEESQLEMLQRLLLPYEAFEELAACCGRKNIAFLSTPFDLPSIAFLERLSVPFWKIPSGEVTNYPYLLRIAQTGKPVVMSTGMCEVEEIDAAVRLLREGGCGAMTLLHCNTEYPTPPGDVNLRAMRTLQERYGCPVGYSDHTQGILAAVAAAAMGASVVEKHFTLSRQMEGPDHAASLEPDELREMIAQIREVETLLGSPEKSVTASERKNRIAARKSIVAARPIRRGETLSGENMTTKRPGDGISPMRWPDLIGRPAPRDFAQDEPISL